MAVKRGTPVVPKGRSRDAAQERGSIRLSRILLIGRNGQVGWELQRTLAPLGALHAVGRETVNLTQPDRVRHLIREFRPSVIVNAAAYTEVDKAESEASTAMAVNANAPGVMAEEAKRLGALLVHYSTDYVFDGNKGSAYIESDQPSPINAYGQSKLEGERAVQLDLRHSRQKLRPHHSSPCRRARGTKDSQRSVWNAHLESYDCRGDGIGIGTIWTNSGR
jgi:hypothetical protein